MRNANTGTSKFWYKTFSAPPFLIAKLGIVQTFMNKKMHKQMVVYPEKRT